MGFDEEGRTRTAVRILCVLPYISKHRLIILPPSIRLYRFANLMPTYGGAPGQVKAKMENDVGMKV